MERIVELRQQPFNIPGRSKGRHNVDFGVNDIYEFYVNKTGNKNNISKTKFTSILREINDLIFKHIIFNGMEYRMPSRLGSFRVRKRKTNIKLGKDGKLDTKFLKVDYKSTRELWASDEEDRKKKTLVFHFNEHTNGYKFPWFWDKRTSNVKNQSYYLVVITRFHNREKAQALLENPKLDYFE